MDKQFTASEVRERERFEEWYTNHAFNYSRDPIGSRDCSLQWEAWKAARTDMLEAQEKAVPVMVVNHVSSAEHDLPIGMKLYTHPSPSDAERLAEALLWIMRAAENAKEPCGNDPESPAAIRNGVLASIGGAAAQGLGIVQGPSLAAHSAQAQPPAASVTDAMVGRAWMALTGRAGKRGYEKDYECMMDVERKSVRAALEAALAAQENPNG